MKRSVFDVFYVCIASAVLLAPARPILADEEPQPISLGEGKLQLTAPAEWKRVEPKVKIIEYEFAAPASEGDEIDGRFTVMGAGGSIEANVERWYGQFQQPDGSDTEDKAKSSKKKVGGQEVHIVDISGTYLDKRGPFDPGTKRENYRMLAAIITTESSGNYFLKFYGPAKTVADQKEAFMSLVGSLKVAEAPKEE